MTFICIYKYISFILIFLSIRPSAVPEIRVYMDPPIERADADTDKDSGKYNCCVFYSLFLCTLYSIHSVYIHTVYKHSFLLQSFTSDDSDEPGGLVCHLPRRLLREHAEKRVRRRAPLNRQRTENNDDTDDEDEKAIPKEGIHQWRKTDAGLVGSRVPAFVTVDMKAEDREELEGLTSALEYYQLFQPDSFVEEVVHQSVLYATQNNHAIPAPNTNTLNLANYRCMEAMLLHGGYAPVPRRRMLWEDKMDCRNMLVADAIRYVLSIL